MIGVPHPPQRARDAEFAEVTSGGSTFSKEDEKILPPFEQLSI